MAALEPPRHYLCVFYGDPQINGDVVDIGLDPDFSAPAPTWGICRPAVRSRWLVKGSHVVFVAYYRPERYLVKGWIRVGELLTYTKALDRFPSRRNVIIRTLDRISPPARPTLWKRKDIGVAIEAKYGNRPPTFLTTIRSGNRTFVQNPEDDHELDNWKCQRLFLDSSAQLRRCIEAGCCLRESHFPTLKGYVVADAWADVGPLRIPWSQVSPPSLVGAPLRTPYHQHNERRLSDEDLEFIRYRVGSLAEENGHET